MSSSRPRASSTASTDAFAAYVGEFYDGPHKFDRAMQQFAFAHLERWLR